MKPFRKKDHTKELMQQAVLFAIDSIRDDICRTADADEQIGHAKAISILAEAYKTLEE